jgi:hypothetical protein
MIVEMRTYKTKPGKRAQFLEILRSKWHSCLQCGSRSAVTSEPGGGAGEHRLPHQARHGSTHFPGPPEMAGRDREFRVYATTLAAKLFLTDS